MKSSTISKIGVIGGSGIYSMDQLKNVEEIELKTPFGYPSDKLLKGEINGINVLFLARHGRKHSFLPSEVPYKANIWAMKHLGVNFKIVYRSLHNLVLMKLEIKASWFIIIFPIFPNH